MTGAAAVRPMTAEEFASWEAHVVEAFATELAEASGADPAETRRQAEAQHRGFLPDGAATARMHVLRVLDGAGVPVGALWVGPAPRRSDAGWVYDIEIDEERRGEGLGRAAMLAAEQVARDEGWTAMGLNVFGPNRAARALYDSLGYEVAATTMTKPLRPAAG